MATRKMRRLVPLSREAILLLKVLCLHVDNRNHSHGPVDDPTDRVSKEELEEWNTILFKRSVPKGRKQNAYVRELEMAEKLSTDINGQLFITPSGWETYHVHTAYMYKRIRISMRKSKLLRQDVEFISVCTSGAEDIYTQIDAVNSFFLHLKEQSIYKTEHELFVVDHTTGTWSLTSEGIRLCLEQRDFRYMMFLFVVFCREAAGERNVFVRLLVTHIPYTTFRDLGLGDVVLVACDDGTAFLKINWSDHFLLACTKYALGKTLLRELDALGYV